MSDAREPLADPGRRAGDDHDAVVEPERGEGVDSHGAAAYERRRRTDAVLVAAFFIAITAWVVTVSLAGGANLLGILGSVLLVTGSTTAIVVLLRVDRRRHDRLADALMESEARSHLLFESSPEPMWVYAPETLRILQVNEAATRVLGWSRDELLRMTVGELLLDLSPRDVRAGRYHGEQRHRAKDGGFVWALVSISPVADGGEPACLCLAHDLTSQRDSEARTRAIVDNAADAILTIDLDGLIESANPSAGRMFGTFEGDLVGVHLANLMKAADGSPITGSMPDFGREVVGVRHDGSTFPLELAVADVALGDRTLSTVIARDVSDRKALERQLTSQATHDPLTALPNRILFFDRLTHALARAERTGLPIAVFFCDLDRFKVVNDSLGHTAGDALLFAAAQRLRDAVRQADTVARFGGDEFVILTENLADETDAINVAEQLTRAFDEPFMISGNELHTTASIGIAVGRPARDSVEGLVRDADAAMYRAKQKGRARFELFDSALRQQAVERLEIEGAMRAGLGQHEFVVHYQPEIELATGNIVGLEALVRWERPGDGLRSPGVFLPVAEETGLIVPIGRAVLEQACREAARWHAELGDRAPTVWVNISARQLASLDLIPMVEDVVTRLLPRPDALGLEITETDCVPDDDLNRGTMAALVDIGVKLAIDDFGTGFASLSYLWRFPSHVVKIDQSFVRRMEDDRDSRVLVKAMIDMAHSLGKTIVAEGVENEAQLAQLRSLGCDTVQGYLLARPQPARDIDALLAAV